MHPSKIRNQLEQVDISKGPGARKSGDLDPVLPLTGLYPLGYIPWSLCVMFLTVKQRIHHAICFLNISSRLNGSNAQSTLRVICACALGMWNERVDGSIMSIRIHGALFWAKCHTECFMCLSPYHLSFTTIVTVNCNYPYSITLILQVRKPRFKQGE